MRENRTYGSEGGEAQAFPTPIGDQVSPPHPSFRLGCRNPVPGMATPSVLAEVRR